MNYLHLEEAVDRIEARWGNSKAWAQWHKLEPEFSPYTAGAMFESIDALFKSGHKFTPTPAEVMAKVQEVQARRIEAGIDTFDRECLGNHVWANPLPTDRLLEGEWVRTCVLCGETRPAPDCTHQAVYRRAGGSRCAYCLVEGVDPISQAETVQPSEAIL